MSVKTWPISAIMSVTKVALPNLLKASLLHSLDMALAATDANNVGPYNDMCFLSTERNYHVKFYLYLVDELDVIGRRGFLWIAGLSMAGCSSCRQRWLSLDWNLKPVGLLPPKIVTKSYTKENWRYVVLFELCVNLAMSWECQVDSWLFSNCGGNATYPINSLISHLIQSL